MRAVGDIAEMRFRSLLAAAAVLIALSGCDGPRAGNAEAGSREAAEFRYVARGIYEALVTESCRPTPALRRAILLADEQAAIHAFEARAGSTARFNLAVARADVGFRQGSNTLGCLDDSDPNFARIHVEAARSRVRSGLVTLEAQTPRLAAGPIPPTLPSPADTAAFRHQVRQLVEMLHPLCQITTEADDDRVTAPARAALSRFRLGLRSPYAENFDLAQADALYERSITMAECTEAGHSPLAVASRNVLAETNRQIARLAAATRL
jgi:hypothetical protein